MAANRGVLRRKMGRDYGSSSRIVALDFPAMGADEQEFSENWRILGDFEGQRPMKAPISIT